MFKIYWIKIFVLIFQNIKMTDQERFDGLFMSAIQNAHGIENFFDAMFSFMRRKTDFFTNQD